MQANALSLQPSAQQLERLARSFPLMRIALPQGQVVGVRQCGQGPVLLCLHGIGSGSASWLEMALDLAATYRVIAWDAPGYGVSSPLAVQAPRATDYAQRLLELVDALALERFVLVGHSLGALMAGAAATANSPLVTRIEHLELISPALGYGQAGRQAAADRVRAERMHTLEHLGIEGMAQQRAGRLLSDQASAEAQQWVAWVMSQLNAPAYRQAIELLCGDDLLGYLPAAMPVRVSCGALDVITPPQACEQVAAACQQPLHLIEGAGHASYVEKPQAVAALLREVL